MSVKLLTEHYLQFLSFKEGCTGSSESTLIKKHCWKSRVINIVHQFQYEEIDAYGLQHILSYRQKQKQSKQSVLCCDTKTEGLLLSFKIQN